MHVSLSEELHFHVHCALFLTGVGSCLKLMNNLYVVS